MSDPRRLIDGTSSELVRQLLEAGVREAPAPEVVERAARALLAGVGAGGLAESGLSRVLEAKLGASGASASTANAGVLGSAGGSTAPLGALASAKLTLAAGSGASGGVASLAKGGVVSAALIKWLGVSAVSLAAASGAPRLLHWAEQRSTLSAPAPRPVPGEVNMAASRKPPAERASTVEAAPAPAPELMHASAPPALAKPRPRVPPAPRLERSAAPPASARLASEMAAIDRARTRLQGGDAEGALHELSRYEIEFPAGQLRLEVLVLRMDALARAGQAGRARELAFEILSAPGSSPHAARARAMLEASPAPGDADGLRSK